jgi:hypothetical protein
VAYFQLALVVNREAFFAVTLVPSLHWPRVKSAGNANRAEFAILRDAVINERRASAR